MRTRRILISVVILSAFLPLSARSDGPRFLPDDPIKQYPDTQNASGVKPYDIDLIYDLAENMFSKPGDRTPNVRAQDVNSIDEVPDSSWYTNRNQPMSVEDIVRGPDTTAGPVEGKWTVIAAKNNGVTPGFTVKDSGGKTWFLKFDAPGYRSMATGTEVVVTKLFWALGYFVPENHIATLRVSNLVIGEGTMIKTPAGKKRRMKQGDIEVMLRQAARNADGSYRVIASLALEGEPLGGFKFYGTRPDDPNDVIPHEHRRELRGYRVFAAWFNHVDSKAINSLDTLVTENGKSYVRHHLLDFGATLGSASLFPREHWEGEEYLFEGGKTIRKDLVSLGFRVEPWRTMKFYESRTIGRMRLNNQNWDPDSWVPRVPNAAFLRARADDKFWAARKAMTISDDMIREVVKTGQFGDEKSEQFLVTALIERRNAIARKYFTGINPVADPQIDSSGTLTFGNAAVAAGVANAPKGYDIVWSNFNNSTGVATKIGSSQSPGPMVKPTAALPSQKGSYLKVEISATESEYPSWKNPVNAYFRLDEAGWVLVGLERLP